MKHLTFAVLLAAFFVSSAVAGPLTRGIQFTGGDNSLASFVLEQAEAQGNNTLELRVSIEGVKNLKGCAFVLVYDSSKYQLVESGKAEDSLFDRTGQPALFFNNETRDGIVVGAMKIDGEHTSTDGPLARFTFKVTGDPSFEGLSHR